MQALREASSLELFSTALLASFVIMCRNKAWQNSSILLSIRVNMFRIQSKHGTLKIGRLGLLCTILDMRNHSYKTTLATFSWIRVEGKILLRFLFHPNFIVKRTGESSDRQTKVLINSNGWVLFEKVSRSSKVYPAMLTVLIQASFIWNLMGKSARKHFS